MAVVKNLMVRVGADLSGFIYGMNKGSGATGNFKKQAEKAMKDTTLSMSILKKAMAQGGKNAAIVSLTDQIRELEAEQKALKDAGFSWGYKGFEGNEALLRDLKSQLQDYISTLDAEPDGPKEWVAQLRELQSVQDQLSGAELYNAQVRMEDISGQLDYFVNGLKRSVDACQPLGAQLSAAKNALKEMEKAGLGIGDAAFDDMYVTVSRLSEEAEEYKNSLEGVGTTTEETSQKTSKLGNAARSALGWMKETASKVLNIGSQSKGSSSGVESLVKSLKRVGLVAVGIKLTKAIFGELQSIVRQYVSENAALQAQVNALKSSLGQALAPAINLVTNALSVLMPYVVGVSNAIGSLITNLFGSGWTTVADGANSAAKAIGGAGGAQKEFNRQLQGFDEINKLNAENSGGGGGGSSSTTTATEGKVPDWMASLTGKVKEAISNDDWAGVGKAIADSLNSGISAIKESDISLGKKISDVINDGIDVAYGFVSTLDWSGIGTVIKTNVSDLFTGIDWKSAFKTLGAAAGGIGTALWSAVSDSFAALGDYFKPFIERSEEIGGNIITGILSGIIAGILDIGSWISENILTPFIDGFKSVFKIHSPSTHEGITSLGKNIMLGIFEGLTEPLRDPIGWIKKNIFAPLSEGFAAVFGEDSLIAKSVSKLFFGDESFGRNLEVDVEANITDYKDNVPNKNLPFKAEIKKSIDQIRNKNLFGYSVDVRKLYDNVTNKTLTNGRLNVTGITDGVGSKVLNNGRLNVTGMSDNVGSKVLNNGQVNVTSWKDNLKDKHLDFKANVTKGWSGSLESALGITTVSTKLNVKTPTIRVTWSTSSANPSDPTSASTRIPSYTAIWNAKGAILSGAQFFGRIGKTLLGGGEAGREAVLPLDRNTWWMDKIADRVALRVNVGQSSGQDITINLILDGKVITSTVVRNVNAQARATGRHPFAAYI